VSIAFPTAMITGFSQKVLVGLPVQVTVWPGPNRILQRVGKGSLDVSEQSAFEERLWDGGTLNRPWPRLMATNAGCHALGRPLSDPVPNGQAARPPVATGMSELKGYTSFRLRHSPDSSYTRLCIQSLRWCARSALSQEAASSLLSPEA
jgi:hypothetical protein